MGGTLSTRLKFTGLDAIVFLGESPSQTTLNIENLGLAFVPPETDIFSLGLPGKRCIISPNGNKLFLDREFTTHEYLLEKKFAKKKISGLIITGTEVFEVAELAKYKELYAKLGISADSFIRTTDKERHWPTVIALWKTLLKAGALEERTYTGLYCAGCERFLTAWDLVDGKCPLHNAVPQEVKEENWFFLMKAKEQWLKELLTREDGYRIIPPFRAPETLSLIEQGLEDVSFSRPKSSLAWGIPVPGQEDQTCTCGAMRSRITSPVSAISPITNDANIGTMRP